jgi:hypothetical protein
MAEEIAEMRASYIAVALLGVGCAGSRLVIEKPIADHCETTGLKGCPQLTEGVLLFVEGDQQRAIHQLRLAINANEPDELLAFANGLKAISALPGAGQFTAPIQQVIDLLATEAAQPTEAPGAKRRASNRSSTSRRPRNVDDARASEEREEGPSGTRVTDDHVVATRIPTVAALVAALPSPPSWVNFDGRTVIPASDESARACAMTGNLWPTGEASKGYCVRVARGPLVITDLHAPSACPAELFALAVTLPGDLAAPRWALYAQPANAIHLSGGNLVVRDSEYFVIGAMSNSDQKMKRDLRCSVTWSGWRPPAIASDPTKVAAHGRDQRESSPDGSR